MSVLLLSLSGKNKRTLLSVTGCLHQWWSGPVALRPRLSPGLPLSLNSSAIYVVIQLLPCSLPLPANYQLPVRQPAVCTLQVQIPGFASPVHTGFAFIAEAIFRKYGSFCSLPYLQYGNSLGTGLSFDGCNEKFISEHRVPGADIRQIKNFPFRHPAALHPAVVRPLALRPRLSPGLPLSPEKRRFIHLP